MQNIIHCFEEAGLGLAPFRYLYCVDGRDNCQFCNTAIRYRFYLLSSDGKKFFVGSDCIVKSGDMGLIDIAKKERNRIAKEKRDIRKAQSVQERQAKFEALRKEKVDKFLTENIILKAVFDWAESQTKGIAFNLMQNLQVWGTLTEKQLVLLIGLYNSSLIKKEECPNGKITIEGTIVSTKLVDGLYGMQHKMIVETNEGYRLFGSVPKSLSGVSNGNKVRLTANVQQSESDKYFGYFSRPSKATLI